MMIPTPLQEDFPALAKTRSLGWSSRTKESTERAEFAAPCSWSARRASICSSERADKSDWLSQLIATAVFGILLLELGLSTWCDFPIIGHDGGGSRAIAR